MAARPRAYWKGYLRLSLVSIAVELYSATSATTGLALHQIHKPSGKRVRYEKTVPGIGPIANEDIVKGVEVDDDTYVVLGDEDLDAIKLETKRTVDLVQFVDHCEIDPRYYERPYYLLPEGDVSTEGYLVIHSALQSSKKVGIGQLSMRGREQLVAVKPCGPGLLLETLRYADEVRAADAFFDDIPSVKLDKEMVALADELIARKSKPFNPSAFEDHYNDALKALVADKRKGHSIVAENDTSDRRAPGKVINLMDALRRSVEERDRKSSKKSPATRSSSRRPSKKRA